ncbi:MAG TPA: HAMP domain-containing sensor histidine kinase [Polyangiaceae bacterium]|nr:HAMP domain-containing sensor histidine kinase [Polyangiaceae bacterium]
MKLRQQLILSLTLVTGVSLTGAFVGVAALFDYSQRKSFDDALLRVAKTESQEATQFNFRFSGRPGPAGSDVGPLHDFGVIYGEHHEVLAATAPFDKALPELSQFAGPPGTPFDFTFENLNLRGVLVPIPSSPGKTVLIASSRENLDNNSRFLHRAMFVGFVVSVAWSTVLVVWMVRRQTVHHENIAAVARRVASGDLAARVTTQASDIEEAQLGRDIDHMIDQLSALVTSQLRFTANAAHELRSPIAAVFGELQQTLRKPRDSDGYRAGIERALRGARRLKQLADDLLTLVRPTGDAVPVKTDIEQLVESAIAPLESFAQERGVTMNLERGAAASQVVGHTRDLERMLRNLVENALRHASQGGVIEVRSELREKAVEIHVTDDGPGVATDDRERIFEPFYRAPDARSIAPDGSGLGLAIAREIARAHRGDITLAPPAAVTRGARFVVRLPTSTA